MRDCLPVLLLLTSSLLLFTIAGPNLEKESFNRPPLRSPPPSESTIMPATLNKGETGGGLFATWSNSKNDSRTKIVYNGSIFFSQVNREI